MEDAFKDNPPHGLGQVHPIDAALFGPFGAIAAEFCAELLPELSGTRYRFMDYEEFTRIRDDVRMRRVYWTEMLLRVHWAATLNLARHQRWQRGCTSAMAASPNFLSFAGNLRGLLESCLDAYYSLGAVPQTLASNWEHIQAALLDEPRSVMHVSKELEDILIHFVYARKLGKFERGHVPTSHEAYKPEGYRNEIPEPHRSRFTQLYEELCGYFHPTAFSLRWLWRELPNDELQVVNTGDQAAIQKLTTKHRKTIEFMLQLSITSSVLCLKTLNWFSLPEVACMAVEHWNFNDVPLWRTVEGMLDAAMARSKAVRRS